MAWNSGPMMGPCPNTYKGGIFEAFKTDGERRTYEQRKIDGDRFREIAKTASFVVLSLIHFKLKIFQYLMKITMN